MKLPIELLMEAVTGFSPFTYAGSLPVSREVGRPHFYDRGEASAAQTEQQNHLWFTDDLSAPLPKGTFLCIGEPRLRYPEETGVLVFPEGTSLTALFNMIQSLFDVYDDWEASSLAAISRFQDYRSLIRVTWDHFHLPVLLTDSQFKIIATAHEENSPFALFESDDSLPSEMIDDLISNPRFRNLEYRSGILLLDLDMNYKARNFQHGGKYCGRLIMGIPEDSLPLQKDFLLEKLAEYTEFLLQKFGSLRIGTSIQNYLHSFLSECLKGSRPGHRELNYLEQNTNWTDEQTYLCAVFLPEHRLKKELYPPYLIAQIEERWNCTCAVEHDNHVVMLFNLSQYGTNRLADFYQSLAYMVRDGLMVAGCSRVFQGLRSLQLYARQAQLAIEFGQKKDATRWYFRFDDYGLEYLLQYGLGAFKPEQVCHPALLLLRSHDQSRQTSYYLTLYTWFREQFNMSQAAARLFIHRSTFINRMERIEELTHLNLEDYNTRLYLELSFCLLAEPDERDSRPMYV